MPFRAAVIAGLFRWSRRCRSKTRQQWLVGYIYHYLYSHCNLFLVHSGEKSASTLPDPYIMNSQSRSRTAPPPFLALNSREWRGLTYASVEEADHQCWLVVVSNIVFFRIFSVEYSNMYNLSINELCTRLSILRGNLYICPHNCIVCVRMVISFYPATRIHVHFSHEGCVYTYFAKAESAFWNADSKRRSKTPLIQAIVRAQVNRKGVYMTSFKRGYMWFCVHASTRISVLL